MAATLEELQVQLNQVSTKLDTEITNLAIHQVDATSNINGLQSQINGLNSEDTDLHTEIHTVAMKTDSNDTRITALESQAGLNAATVASLQTTVSGNKDSLEAKIEQMNTDHHDELHALGIALDKQDAKLIQFQEKQAMIPNHVVLSEEEYAGLTDPDPGTFYFTYEEE